MGGGINAYWSGTGPDSVRLCAGCGHQGCGSGVRDETVTEPGHVFSDDDPDLWL